MYYHTKPARTLEHGDRILEVRGDELREVGIVAAQVPTCSRTKTHVEVEPGGKHWCYDAEYPVMVKGWKEDPK